MSSQQRSADDANRLLTSGSWICTIALMQPSRAAVRNTCILPRVLLLLLLPSGAAAQMVVEQTWQGASDGQFPRGAVLVRGEAGVASHDGVQRLRVSERAHIDILLASPLPQEFIVEFDMLVPQGTSYPVEIRAEQANERLDYRGPTLRQRFVTAHCGAIRTGVYGVISSTRTIRQADSVARALHRCRVRVSAGSVEVTFANSGPMSVSGVSFGSSDRLRLLVPAIAGQEAYIGTIRVMGTSGASPIVAESSQPVALQPGVVPTRQLTTPPLVLLGNAGSMKALTTAALNLQGATAASVTVVTAVLQLAGHTGAARTLTTNALNLTGAMLPPVAITTPVFQLQGSMTAARALTTHVLNLIGTQ